MTTETTEPLIETAEAATGTPEADALDGDCETCGGVGAVLVRGRGIGWCWDCCEPDGSPRVR